jgi:arginyl-tRNA synthetase
VHVFLEEAETALSVVIHDLGLTLPATLSPCIKREHGDVSTNIGLRAASLLKRSSMSVAQEVAAKMACAAGVSSAEVVAPGYVNLTFTAAVLAQALAMQDQDPHCGIVRTAAPETVFIDFGGPNIKPMHVGHLRSLVIGECLRRLLVAVGHDVTSDIHLGDWGLPSGMILSEIAHRVPDAPWFQAPYAAVVDEELPVTAEDMATLYPVASAACKASPARMDEARRMTALLQAGAPGLNALWNHVVALAKGPILETCDRLGAHFDLLLGESDAQAAIPEMLDGFKRSGLLRSEGAALLIDLAEDGDRQKVPPLVLEKEDGSALYATTDLSTLMTRVRDGGADRVIYVVDDRQALHFLQVFRVAAKTGLSGGAALEHIGFGTVNGLDGKPFRTRDGNTIRLEDLLGLAIRKARERLVTGGRMDGDPVEVLDEAAEAIGLAALRIADLSGKRGSGYVLDIDRALSFEGRTGPHLLYALVRLRSVLGKATVTPGRVVIGCAEEHDLAMGCLGLGAAVQKAVEGRAPNELVAYAFELAKDIGSFYLACPVLAEPDAVVQASRLALCVSAERSLAMALELLGCRSPKAM